MTYTHDGGVERSDFDYDYPDPEAGVPFGIVVEMADAPWAPTHQLVHIGLRSTPVATDDLPPNNLVLVDVSGSMSSPDKLPLLRDALSLLVGQLRPQDRAAIVVYAGAAGMVLPPTSGAVTWKMLSALSSFKAGGSTAGGASIRLAYWLARGQFIEDGNNRVILATDGHFNVGVSSDGELVELIERERESGVYLSVLGFGTGDRQDAKMERIADDGNGNYAYIDGVREARRVLVEQMGATLLTVANDVKLQVEFNPARVKGYRLIGYENRRLRNEEFNDDTRDAGDLGAGHSVTALYEIIPADSDEPVPGVDPLRYRQVAPQPEVGIDEVLTVKLRYKQPGESESRLVARTLTKPEAGDDGPSEAFRFASAVAEFGLLLRDSPLQGRGRVRARLRTCPRSSRCRRRRAPQRAARADPHRRRPDERPARVDRDDRRPDTGTSPIGSTPVRRGRTIQSAGPSGRDLRHRRCHSQRGYQPRLVPVPARRQPARRDRLR